MQAATLLVIIGEEARKVYSTFTFEAEEDKNNVDALTAKFEEFYRPETKLTYHEFLFGSRNQREGKPFNEWLTGLRMLTTNCEFGVMEDRMLRSRIILGIRDKNLQQKLIAKNPSFKKTIDICRTQEQGKQQFHEISEAVETAQDMAVNAVAKKGDACGRCGYRAHHGERCPATGGTCNKCGGFNHFARACKSATPSRTVPSKKKELRELCAEDGNFISANINGEHGQHRPLERDGGH